MRHENPPNVRRIDTGRDDVCAFEISGHITTYDVENLYGLVEGAYTVHERIDVIVLFHDYEGFDWSAAWRHKVVLGKTRALKHIRRYAVVGGPGWIKAALAVVRPFVSAEVRHFDAAQADAAWAWVDASPASR